MRDTVICFRTSEQLRKALEGISQNDRRSLSSVIENALYDYVSEERAGKVQERSGATPGRRSPSLPS